MKRTVGERKAESSSLQHYELGPHDNLVECGCGCEDVNEDDQAECEEGAEGGV